MFLTIIPRYNVFMKINFNNTKHNILYYFQVKYNMNFYTLKMIKKSKYILFKLLQVYLYYNII